MVLGKSAIKSGFARDQTSNTGNGTCGLFSFFFALKFSETFKSFANLNRILIYPRSLFPSFHRKICMLQPIGRTRFRGATQKLKMGEGHPWWSSG